MKLIVLLLAAIVATVMANCPAGTPASPLCNSNTVTASIRGDCTTQTAKLASRSPCCHLKTLHNQNGCPTLDGSAVCRYAEIDRPACDPTAGAECRAMSVKFTLETETQEGTCCDSCSCWGDPHCESFNGVNDTWILCDSRAKTKYGCGLSKNVCVGQVDHNGNPCKWVSNSKRWNVGLKGSQCQFDMENQDMPEINMYEFNGFSAKIDLGERGVITQLKLKSKSGDFYLTSDNCFEDFGKQNAFRAEEGAANPPLNDENWLPYSWTPEKVEGGDILWTMAGLEESIIVNIRCTRTAVVQGGKVRFGPPRLNIDSIIEPVNPNSRPNAGGFCVTDSINKYQSSHEHTDKIELERTCADASDELAISKLLCGRGITRSGIRGCKKRWCQSVRSDVDACLNDIENFKWRRVFCAANTLVTGKASGCTVADCKQCMSDISDFGWESSILKWTGKVTEVADGDCLTAADLPTDLVGCQRGIRIQYEATPDNWLTYKAIPKGSILCDGALEFQSSTDAVLFNNRIRVAQCNAPAQCTVDTCTPEDGFEVTFDFVAEEDVSEELTKLVENGDLVCDPEKYDTPDECLTVDLPDMCPCPN